MNKFLGALALAASAALAQSPCFDTNYGTGVGNGDDVTLPLQSIGFSFPFGGTTYTDFYPTTNGFVYLRNGAAATTPSALCCTGIAATMLANTVGPMLCAYWTDLNLTTANAGQVYVNSSASVCTITWFNTIEYAEPTNTRFHLQMKLYPSGQVDVTYTTNVSMRTTGDCIVGVTPGNGATDPGTSDLSAGGTSTTDTLYEIFNNTALPADLGGLTLTLISSNPTVPGSPIVYVTSACPIAFPPAFNTSYGQGCVRSFNSFYELFASSGAFDLNGAGMTMLATGTGYIALPGTTTYVAPSASATTLGLTDDSEQTVALTTPFPVNGGTTPSLTVCSNGFVSVATGNGVAYTPGTAFLGWAQTVFLGCWHDYNVTIAGSGQVKFEEIAGIAYVTWDGVLSYGTTAGPDTWQMQFDTTTGNVHVVWVSAAGVGNGKLVGFSPGGASQNPGSIDLSTTLPTTIAVTNGPELVPLGLTATGTASPGGTVTLNATNIPVGSPFGLMVFGLVQFNPGLPLDGIGMAGCFQYNEASSVTLFLSPATGTTFTAPTGTAFLGVNIEAQAAAFAPGTTALGFISSNGIRMTLGT